MQTDIYALLRSRNQLPPGFGGPLPGIGAGQGGAAQAMPAFTTFAPTPLAAPVQQPVKGRGFLGAIDDVFGGPDMANLTPEQRKAARRKGLLAFGAQMLTATDPRGNRAQGLSALGQGVMAAQGGYGQGIEQGMAQQDAQAQASLWAQMQPLPGESPKQTYDRLQQAMMAAIQMGKPQVAQTIAGVLQTMPSLLRDTKKETLTPWEAKGFATKEDYLAYMREETAATQRPFAPQGGGSGETYRNPYLSALGTRMDNLRAEIVGLEAGKGPSEVSRALRAELRGLDQEFKGLMQKVPGAPPPPPRPSVNPVTNRPIPWK